MLAQRMQLALHKPAVCKPSRRHENIRCNAVKTVEAEVKEEVAAPAEPIDVPAGKAAIYIGHGKDQVAEKKAGKKGRVVVDDPSKYPQRTELTGGWAGGEAGLKAFVAALEQEKEAKAIAAKAAAARAPQPAFKGSDTIYVGKGRVIQDDARKYPSRNELTGGFAGGELGLSVFKEKGDVPIAPEGRGKRQSSPLITAFVLGAVGTGAGLLFSTVQEVGTDALLQGAAAPGLAAPAAANLSVNLDERTKAIVEAAVLLVGVIGTVAGTQVLIDNLATRLREGASKLAILAAFWLGVFFAAKAVLEG